MPESTTLWTDGFCETHLGAWAFLLDRSGGPRESRSGTEADTSLNKMELTAVLEGLRELTPGSVVVVRSVSSRVKAWLTKPTRYNLRSTRIICEQIHKLIENNGLHVSFKHGGGGDAGWTNVGFVRELAEKACRLRTHRR